MAGDFQKPNGSSTRTGFMQEIRDLNDAQAKMFNGIAGEATNYPDGCVRYNSGDKRFEIYASATQTWSPLDISATAITNATNATNHIARTDNPHSTTAEQVGAEPANSNIQSHISATAPHSGHALSSHTHSYEPANTNIQAHISSTSNPHGTTAAQVGAALASHGHSGADITDGTVTLAKLKMTQGSWSGNVGKGSAVTVNIHQYSHLPETGSSNDDLVYIMGQTSGGINKRQIKLVGGTDGDPGNVTGHALWDYHTN